MSTRSNILRSALEPLFDFIFPPTCLSCGRLRNQDEKHLCSQCWHQIPLLHNSHTLFFGTRDRLLSTGAVDDLVSVYVFEEESPFQHLVHALKYDGFKSIGRMLGRSIGERMAARGMSPDLIVPAPLHRTKQRERGFNQAEIIAEGVSEIIRAPVERDLLKRTRHTHTQTKLSIDQREGNVRGAFSVDSKTRKALKGNSCIIVDDVITTGATIASAAAELKKAGIDNVVAASTAIAILHKDLWLDNTLRKTYT